MTASATSSQIDVRAGNTTSALLSINGSNKYMMTLEPVTSSRSHAELSPTWVTMSRWTHGLRHSPSRS